MLEEPWKETEQKKLKDQKPDLEESGNLKHSESNLLTDEKYEAMVKNFTAQENSKKNIEELNQTLDAFYENNLKQRQQALAKIQLTVGGMLNASKKEIGCQTEKSLIEDY